MSDFTSKSWRLNNLYRIVDKSGNSIPFRLNAVQADVCSCLHRRKLILKARQLGMSTYSVIDILDDAIHTNNLSCGIVSYSLEHAQHIFKRILGHALDTLKPRMRDAAKVVAHSAREITFRNGSFLRVDTTLRGAAYSNVLVSEFGKTCARSPLKAEEVITGTLQAIPVGGKCTIESTAEGNDGFFADLCHQAAQRGNNDLTDLDYHLFFYPWYKEEGNRLDQKVTYENTVEEYFRKIEIENECKLDQRQRYWYAHQMTLLGDKIKQEHPSTISECFLASSDAYYFAYPIADAYKSDRCPSIPIYDALAPVYVSMDIGINDLTVMIFFQLVHGEIRIIDYYEDNAKGVDFYARFLLQDKKYVLHTIFLPHDATHRDGIIVENTYEREFRRYFTHTATKFIVLRRTDKNLNISHAKLKMQRCVFALNKVKKLLDHVSKYRKKWSEQYGKYLDEPYHDEHSNYADALIYALQAVTYLETAGSIGDPMKKHKQAIEQRGKAVY